MRYRERLSRAVALLALTSLAAVGALALVVAQPADAAWTPYINVSKQQDVEHPIVEMDPAGDAVFLWRQGFDSGAPGIYTRVRNADGSLSPIQRISIQSGEYDLAVDADGDAYYVWTNFDDSVEHLQTRVRFADGTLSPVQTLKNTGRGEFVSGTVGVNASGTAAFAWYYQRSDEELPLIQARSRSPSGGLSPIRTVAQVPIYSYPSMGVDAAGEATLLWEGRISEHSAELTRVLRSDGTLSPVVRVSRMGYGPQGGQVAVTPAGRAVFRWDEYKAGKVTALARSRDPDGTLQPPQVLAAFDSDQGSPLPAAGLAIAPDGRSVVSWQRGGALQARTRAFEGTLGPVKTITPGLVRDSDLGIDSQGNMVFAWTLWPPHCCPSDGFKSRVFVRSEDADGTLGPTRALSLAGYNAYWPDLAVIPAGDAAVTWQEGIGGFAIQAAFGP